jgi:hypothetical protein
VTELLLCVSPSPPPMNARQRVQGLCSSTTGSVKRLGDVVRMRHLLGMNKAINGTG